MSAGDLERAVLGSLIIRPQYFEQADLTPALFSSGRFRKAFEIISELWETTREEISLPVLAERIGGEDPGIFVAGLVDGLHHFTPGQFVQSVEYLMWLRRTREIGRDLAHELALEEKTGLPDRASWGRIFEKIDVLRKSNGKQPGAILRLLSEIEPQAVTWTWPNRIPRGKLTLIVGDPGLGKSFFCVDLAARISQGRKWPDCPGQADQGAALLLTAEDGLADTVRVRADAAGADASRLIVLEGVREGGEVKSFNLAEHVPILEAVIRDRPDLALIVIDPLSAYLGDLDSHKNAEVRGALAPLSALAEKSNVSIVGVSHLNKSTASEKAIYRVMGSLSFVAAARACWGVIMDPEDPDQDHPSGRVLIPVKTNLSVRPEPLAFKIDESARLVYDPRTVHLNADEAMNSNREDREQRSIAETWLRDVLKSGPLDVKAIRKQAQEEGIPVTTVYRAAQKIGIIRSRVGFSSAAQSVWKLRP